MTSPNAQALVTCGRSAAIELRNVSARYARGHGEPLRQVDFVATAGEIVCLLGPNGAGKSTLLRVASGALCPYEGDALLFGEPMARMDRRHLARTVAVVAQNETIALGFSVRDVVTMGRAPHQGSWMLAGAHDRRIVDAALARCDLESLASRLVHELSGGEQKRVAIARALAQEPRVLLLDEPAAFLDVRHQIDLCELLVEQTKLKQLACIVVLHDLNLAASYASRVALLKNGEVLACGPVAEVMTYRRLRETFSADLYVGLNDVTGDRFFLPMRHASNGIDGSRPPWQAPGDQVP